jgi:hypothetical protein
MPIDEGPTGDGPPEVPRTRLQQTSMTTTQQPTGLTPFAGLADDERPTAPMAPDRTGDADQEIDDQPVGRRRWSTGHTVAAAIVAGGVLLSGGAAVAAGDSSTSTPGIGQFAQPGQLPGQGQQPGQGPLPGQQGAGGLVPGQPPGMPGTGGSSTTTASTATKGAVPT